MKEMSEDETVLLLEHAETCKRVVEMSETHFILWEIPTSHPVFTHNEVNIWCGTTDVLLPQLSSFTKMLSPAEVARADRFRFAHHRTAFIVAHGLMRTILGRYLQCEPSHLQLASAMNGKPYLQSDNQTVDSLRFNLSHTEGLILLALAQNREVGIDVERIQDDMDFMTMAEQFFAVEEVQRLRQFPSEDLPEAFFRCWTRKEAYLKARGDGLTFPTQQFAVSCTLESPISLSVTNELSESQRWRLYHLAPHAQYIGALACEGEPGAIRYYQASS